MRALVATLSTQPTAAEWRSIREFKRRALELHDNSLVKNGYALNANVSIQAGEVPKFTVRSIPDEEPFRALLLTFRLFWANDEPSNFLRVVNILSRHIDSDRADARDVLNALRSRWNQALFGGLMFMSFNDKDLNANTVFDLWLNAHYFHSDAEKQNQLDRLSRMLTPEFLKFLLANAVTECCKAIFVLSDALNGLTVPEQSS